MLEINWTTFLVGVLLGAAITQVIHYLKLDLIEDLEEARKKEEYKNSKFTEASETLTLSKEEIKIKKARLRKIKEEEAKNKLKSFFLI